VDAKQTIADTTVSRSQRQRKLPPRLAADFLAGEGMEDLSLLATQTKMETMTATPTPGGKSNGDGVGYNDNDGDGDDVFRAAAAATMPPLLPSPMSPPAPPPVRALKAMEAARAQRVNDDDVDDNNDDDDEKDEEEDELCGGKAGRACLLPSTKGAVSGVGAFEWTQCELHELDDIAADHCFTYDAYFHRKCVDLPLRGSHKDPPWMCDLNCCVAYQKARSRRRCATQTAGDAIARRRSHGKAGNGMEWSNGTGA
jgi:hypothetical protein